MPLGNYKSPARRDKGATGAWGAGATIAIVESASLTNDEYSKQIGDGSCGRVGVSPRDRVVVATLVACLLLFLLTPAAVEWLAALVTKGLLAATISKLPLPLPFSRDLARKAAMISVDRGTSFVMICAQEEII